MKTPKPKTFKLMEAYDYTLDRVFARIILLIENEECTFIEEEYYDDEAKKIIDPEYYNPLRSMKWPDYEAALQCLHDAVVYFKIAWSDAEVDIR